ncbi:hypothetical protein HVX64_23550 (plasmid) [Citrobacter sp. RHB20-C16]|uniref:hypothetical protein n=1 Tax=Citrobacter TaxID=544 RepID=UPI00102115D6|nr:MULTISPECIES: hypothetical protein [Citrobacter]MZK91452.1 hypothetical protein [Citrobacter amalonaticus]MZK96008.1 hypothetical protein [Citrobacter amalonaticus]MZL05724.1 hypothetical protein [Citrobacter amalonaticus]MZL25777.1 hypothetical protein [Citrobacter amalonaticus]MZL43664.1 hypothetical protein [Citrobacter amalonaticus]
MRQRLGLIGCPDDEFQLAASVGQNHSVASDEYAIAVFAFLPKLHGFLCLHMQKGAEAPLDFALKKKCYYDAKKHYG